MELSTLPKTWIIDVDGTLVKHNGYLIDGEDTILDGIKEFFDKISPQDTVILMTARKESDIGNLKKFLKKNKIKYDLLISDIPSGERILINDKKTSGLLTAFCINKNRDEKLHIDYVIKETL